MTPYLTRIQTILTIILLRISTNPDITPEQIAEEVDELENILEAHPDSQLCTFFDDIMETLETGGDVLSTKELFIQMLYVTDDMIE